MKFVLLLRQSASPDDEVTHVGPDRSMALMLDGLRASQQHTLPGLPLTSADLNWSVTFPCPPAEPR
jgi:hypothetical protein